MTNSKLKTLLQRDSILVVPAAFDMVSARSLKRLGSKRSICQDLDILLLTLACRMPGS